mmetsp:Transcript_48207/g.77776  ORF Transcript_48207/g.77776 Transcript_48207/m.77776 type:complete len:256 (+) Transcript_48207:4065-4832(+)
MQASPKRPMSREVFPDPAPPTTPTRSPARTRSVTFCRTRQTFGSLSPNVTPAPGPASGDTCQPTVTLSRRTMTLRCSWLPVSCLPVSPSDILPPATLPAAFVCGSCAGEGGKIERRERPGCEACRGIKAQSRRSSACHARCMAQTYRGTVRMRHHMSVTIPRPLKKEAGDGGDIVCGHENIVLGRRLNDKRPAATKPPPSHTAREIESRLRSEDRARRSRLRSTTTRCAIACSQPKYLSARIPFKSSSDAATRCA